MCISVHEISCDRRCGRCIWIADVVVVCRCNPGPCVAGQCCHILGLFNSRIASVRYLNVFSVLRQTHVSMSVWLLLFWSPLQSCNVAEERLMYGFLHETEMLHMLSKQAKS